MPLTFEALKGQRYRWCFGGIQILRMHLRSLLPGRESKENRLSTGQRWSYLSGGLQWYGDLLGLIFLVFLLAGAVNLATGGGELFRKLTAFLVATVPVLVLLGLVRAVALLRRGHRRVLAGRARRVPDLAVHLARRRAGVRARPCSPRKPRSWSRRRRARRRSWWEALRANWAESFLALLGCWASPRRLPGLPSWPARCWRCCWSSPPWDGRGAGEQLGGAARGPAGRPARAADHGVEAVQAPDRAGPHRGRGRGRRGGRRRRRGRRPDARAGRRARAVAATGAGAGAQHGSQHHRPATVAILDGAVGQPEQQFAGEPVAVTVRKPADPGATSRRRRVRRRRRRRAPPRRSRGGR